MPSDPAPHALRPRLLCPLIPSLMPSDPASHLCPTGPSSVPGRPSQAAPQAHALYVTANPTPTAKVCFLDSGIWGGHPDLGPNIDQTVGYNAITRQSGFAAQTDDW